MIVNLDRPENSEIELRSSQNLFSHQKTQNQFITISYLLYTITFLPSLTATILTKYNPDFKSYIKSQNYLIIISFVIVLLIGYGQSFSKILARKYPVNFLLYFFYIICLSFLFAKISEEFCYEKIFVFLLFLISNGISCFLFCFFNQGFFFVKYCVGFVFGVLLVLQIVLGLVFNEIVIFVFSCGFFVFGISVFVMVAMECLSKNKNFLLLPDDYIMGCMKMAMLVPLLGDIYF